MKRGRIPLTPKSIVDRDIGEGLQDFKKSRSIGPLNIADAAAGATTFAARWPPPCGQGRLSYQRAWSLFREASGGQWTLHQLRHSALTHLGEDGVSAPLLMAKSRHRDLRTLSRYVRPGTEAVVRLTAEHDHARRGKHPRHWSYDAQK